MTKKILLVLAVGVLSGCSSFLTVYTILPEFYLTSASACFFFQWEWTLEATKIFLRI